MKFFLDHIRSKSRSKNTENFIHESSQSRQTPPQFPSNPTAHLPLWLLEKLLRYVCPCDDSFTSCEDTTVANECMICDLNHLSQCALVSKQWSEAAQNVLYHHIRIDPVHYCDRESELAIQRKRRSVVARGGSHPSSPQERLKLLSRTVRDNERLAKKVHHLKTPYTTREGSVADLMRTIFFLPNLLYVDLPEGCYSDDPYCDVLKQELLSRCPKIRHMKYNAGSEGSFQILAQSNQWRELEVLELTNLAVETNTIVGAFVSLTALREVKMVDMPLLDDAIFVSASSHTPCLPRLNVLAIQNAPNISTGGLMAYVSQPGPQQSLSSLTLINTGISALDLHQLLSATPNLIKLHSAVMVTRGAPSPQTPPLASASLRTLHYEVANAETPSNILASPSDSYYAYLISSILSGMLPSLTHLYTLSVTPRDLLQSMLQPSDSSTWSGPISKPSPLGLKRPLRLLTKSVSELEWDLTLISPPSSAHRRGNSTPLGPESLQHALPLSPQYGNQSRQSVIVGNGFGGFLAVPSPGFPPHSPESTKSERKDLDAWMG